MASWLVFQAHKLLVLGIIAFLSYTCTVPYTMLAGDPDASPQESEEYSFPRRNWVIAILLQGLVSATYCIILPSMHQLVTNPTSDNQQKNATVDKVFKSWSPPLTRHRDCVLIKYNSFDLRNINHLSKVSFT